MSSDGSELTTSPEPTDSDGSGSSSSSDSTASSAESLDLLDSLPDYMADQMRSRQTRQKFTKLSGAAWATLAESLATRLGQSRADATWSTLASVLNGFLAFDRAQRSNPAYSSQELDWKMLCYIEWKILQHHLTGSSPLTYAKRLSYAYRRMVGRTSEVFREYMKALRRQGMTEVNGARPITVEELKRALTLNRDCRLQIVLMWALAARANDVDRLLRQDFTETPEGYVVQWNQGTKRGPQRLVDVLLLPDWAQNLLKNRLDSLKPTSKVACHGHAKITAALRRVAPDLSSHSIKKGALCTLIDQGLPLNQVAFKAKHASLDQLRVYVGERRWALAHGVIDMAEKLKALTPTL